MRLIRTRLPDGTAVVAVEDPERHGDRVLRFLEAVERDALDVLREGWTASGHVVETDAALTRAGSGGALLRPLDPPEVWCAGVTYERSRDARVDEATVKDVYTMVYDAHRPELFLKDAGCRRTVGPGEPIGIREDSTWNVPEPEIGVVIGDQGKILGYTIGNDVSSRDIEGANPLYLPQAKVYAGACAIGPAILVADDPSAPFEITMRITDDSGDEVFSGSTSTAHMRRGFEELVSWLVRDNPVPAGSVLLTGTGLVPPDQFTLHPGHVVEIAAPRIGTLVNPVVLASTLL
ncbi:MAG: fumarylacetoacetate hydrolase family protein [Thermoleophilia bacterium]|nr:fumarylacetoacetate hydrolase family protein [Thermoleophilia bacterium]